ncbi:MAG: GNAT family N-acetyltransferase [Fimbriimonadaceae bacterium]|nr:GNAT family N-acetyltransferase [Fimbriimonadaceae bacterium]
MRLEWVPNIERFVPEWRTLHSNLPMAHPFHSPEWVTAWYETAGRLFWPRILAGYEGKDLVMVWPFASTLRTWYIAGSGVSDYLEPLSRRPVELEGIVDQITELRPALVDLHQLPEDLPTWPGAEKFYQATCLRKDLPNNISEVMRGLSPSLQQDIAKAGRNGSLQFDWVEPRRFFPIFFELHRQRWARKHLPGAFLLRGRRRFHEAVAERGERILRTGLLTYEGEPIGAMYGLVSGNRAFFYQTGFLPEHSRLSPGSVMIADFMKRGIEEGLSTFDFLRGDERYKQRWRPNSRCQSVRQIWPADASIVAKAAVMHHHIDRWLRDKLEA